MNFDITNLSSCQRFTGRIVVALGQSPRNILNLLKFRTQLAKYADKILIVHSSRFRSFHAITTQILRLTGLKVDVIYSPESRRHGLTVNRILKASDSARVTFLNDSSKCAVCELEAFLANSEDSDDSNLLALRSLSSSGNIPTRLDATAVTVSTPVTAFVGDLDESFDCFQDVVDDLHGRITNHSLMVGAIGVGDSRPQPPIHPVNLDRFPWLGASMSLTSQSSNGQNSHITNSAHVGSQLSILIDLRDSTFQLNGTAQHTSSTVEALSIIEGIAVTVAISNRTHQLFDVGSDVKILTAPSDTELQGCNFDISFVARQIDSRATAEKHRSLARFIIASHLDVIAYSNPCYFADVTTWQESQQETFHALQLVDGIAWLTDSVANSVRELRLVENVTQRVCGTVVHARSTDSNSDSLNSSGPYIATIGTSYHHKSRMYALRVFYEMVRAGWNGDLVLAGWDPPTGSSKVAEEEFVQSRGLIDRVRWSENLAHDDITRTISAARALIQPSVSEGFGLVPFEAGLLGTPVFVAQRSSMKELLPNDFGGWLTGNTKSDAAHIAGLNEANANEIVTHLQRVALDYTTEKYAQRLERLVRDVVSATS